MKSVFLSFLIASFVFSQAIAQTHSGRTTINTPEQELAGFTLADGFIIELVASERDGVVNPIDLTFDDAGRLWTQTATMYPLDPIADLEWQDLLNLLNDPEAQKKHPNFKLISDLYQGRTKGDDKILVLSNLYGASPIRTTIWAEGLTIPQSIFPYKDGAFVAQGSEIFLLRDTDNDGIADKRTPFFTGFGFVDTHTMSHTLVRAPGGWVHFSHGALNKGEVTSLQSDLKLRMDYSKIGRFSLDGQRMEVVSSGLNNIWGFQLRHSGEWYGSEANDLGYSIAPMEPGTGFPGIGNQRIRSYQPWMPPLHEFRVGGTGISGAAFSDDRSGSFPEEWKDVALLANPITSSINAVRIVRNEDGTVSAEHLPDLLTSEDDWFRPVNIEFGPDGCLYIADWYNKIVSHNELPTTHPDRDKTHGRIWRIRHVSQKPRKVPNLYEVATKDLVSYLESPSLWGKRAAWHQISDRPHSETKNLAKGLTALASDIDQDEITRIHALWSLEGIRHYDPQLMLSLIHSPLHHLQREAIRSLNSFSLQPSEITGQLSGLIEDRSPTIRSQTIRTLAEINKADQKTIDLLLKAAKPELPGNEMGGAYERKFERYLVRMALEKYPDELKAYLNSPSVKNVPKENLMWAIQALPGEDKELAFLTWWPKADVQQIDQPTFISIAQMLHNVEIYKMMEPTFRDPSQSLALLHFSLENQAQVQSPQLASILLAPVSQLLKSKNEADIHLALAVGGRFNIKNLREPILDMINSETSDKTLSLALETLENDPKTNRDIFLKVFQNKSFGFDRRANALNSLSKADKGGGSKAFEDWIPELNSNQQAELVKILSGSKTGVDLLLSAYEQQLLSIPSFDLSSAERIAQTYEEDVRGEEILDAVRKAIDEERFSFKTKLVKYMAIAAQKDGDPIKGKALFQTCLMCHAVGNEGQDIAPALDDSSRREHEALFTAILDPDAAVESNYAVYRVTKKDGGNVEGYLVNKDERGTTLAFMGGARVFIEVAAIRGEGFLGGRSFMPKGLIDSYTDHQVADLVSYINSLK